jgi:hypothetical protein
VSWRSHQVFVSNKPILYVAAPGIWWRVFAVAVAAGTLWLLGTSETATGDLLIVAAWVRFGWFERALLALIPIAIPLFLLECFCATTVFLEDEIAVRNIFGQWRRYKYRDVRRFDRIQKGSIEIHFSSERTLRLGRWMADLERVAAILRERTHR